MQVHSGGAGVNLGLEVLCGWTCTPVHRPCHVGVLCGWTCTHRSEQTMAALRRLSSPLARVLRDGEMKEVGGFEPLMPVWSVLGGWV